MINEIFESVQGEGLNVGEKQIFVRFFGCNLNCIYCDTHKNASEQLNGRELFNKISKFTAKTVSFTGGEPLLHAGFIKNFLLDYKKILNKKIYLETNGTLFNELVEIIDFVDTVGMDIKIKSASGSENRFDLNEKFLNVAQKKAFIKVVFDKNIKDIEIKEVSRLGMKFDVPVVLQPKMPLEPDTPYLQILDKFFTLYESIRLIPQMHKFLNIL